MTQKITAYQLDFEAIGKALKARKWVVIITTIAFLALGSIYNAFRLPQYRAEVLLLPPTEKELTGLILARIPLNRSDSPEIFDLLDSVEIFKKFKMDLASRPYQLDFFELYAKELVGETEVLPEYRLSSSDGFGRRSRGADFAALTAEWRLQRNSFLHWPYIKIGDPVAVISVDSDRTTSRPYILVSFTWLDPVTAATFANRYVDFINEKTVNVVKDLMQSGLDIRTKNIEGMIDYQRKLAQKTVDDYIVEIKEAISIAEVLEIEDPTNAFGDYNIITVTPPPTYYVDPAINVVDKKPNSSQRYLPLYHPGNIAKSIRIGKEAGSTPPLYTRGWKALQQELTVLENRSSLDPFIPDLRNLTEQVNWFKSLDYNETIFRAAHIAHRALPPISPVGPTTTVFMIFSLFAGLLVGSFFALVVHALKRSKSSA